MMIKSEMFFVWLLRSLFIGILVVMVVVQIPKTYNRVKRLYHPDMALGIMASSAWLKQHSSAQDVVLTTWADGMWLAVFADRPVLATCKIYPSQSSIFVERYKDMATFFFAQDLPTALKVVHKYNVKYVWIRKSMFDFYLCKYIQACGLTRNARTALTPEGMRLTLIGKMLEHKPIDGFESVYEDPVCMISKVAAP